jgi:hypothetical protein
MTSTSADFHASSCWALPCLERRSMARWSRVFRTRRPSMYSVRVPSAR